MWGKLQRTLDLDDYNQDQIGMRSENQMLKREIREMIDQALTPEVRAFMPVMLDKMAEIGRLG